MFLSLILRYSDHQNICDANVERLGCCPVEDEGLLSCYNLGRSILIISIL